MKEIWKDIPNYEGIYQVSNIGRVKRIAAQPKNLVNTIRKPFINSNGYAIVDLYKNTVRTKKSIHRLVTITFTGEPEQGYEVNHINGNKTDNRLENLEYLTRSDNNKHAFSINLRTNVGENASRSIFTEEDVKHIRSRYEGGGCTHRSLAKEYGVSKSAITAILLRYNWKHIP